MGVPPSQTLPAGRVPDIFVSGDFMSLFLSAVMATRSQNVVAANGQGWGWNSLINAKWKRFLPALGEAKCFTALLGTRLEVK